MALIDNPANVNKRTVGCIMTLNGDYLLEPRTKDGLWGSVSGGIHDGETPKEAIIREIKEELGLEIKPSFFRTTHHTYGGKTVEYNIFEYEFHNNPSDKITLNKESHSFKFFTFDEAMELELYEDEDYCLTLHKNRD